VRAVRTSHEFRQRARKSPSHAEHVSVVTITNFLENDRRMLFQLTRRQTVRCRGADKLLSALENSAPVPDQATRG